MKYTIFERFGVELEYMLVQKDTLDIAPVADILLFDAGADMDGDLQRGRFAWSNELTNHVVELKTAQPVDTLNDLHASMHAEVNWFQEHAARHSCILMPTAMHPWMNPLTETRLWPHGNSDIYQTYDRIFHCQGHGWANVQSTHLNLSFSGDEEFARLHAAIRIILPLLPALAASSPLFGGFLSDQCDSRLFHYRENQASIPEIAGQVIPEPLYSEKEYRRGIFDPIAAAMKKHDPDSVLELDFLNSRGAIARFDRGSIEIRLLDIQECPAADISILQLVIATLKWILKEGNLDTIKAVPTEKLAELLWRTAKDGEDAMVDVEGILDLCGYTEPVKASHIWRTFFAEVGAGLCRESMKNIASILMAGTLSSRIRKAVGANPDAAQLKIVYQSLADCLTSNQLFQPS